MFLLASLRSSCLLRRNSLSNHFLLKDILCRLVLVVFIFRHRFAVLVKIASTASREEITFSDGTVSSRNRQTLSFYKDPLKSFFS